MISESLATAEQVAQGPAAALAAAKALVNEAAGMDRLDVHLDHELRELTRIAETPAFAEGLNAFFERRPPDFAQTEEEQQP